MSLSSPETLAIERLKGLHAGMESLLGELVSLNSHTENHEGVNAVGRVVERHLLASGLKTGCFVTGEGGQHLVGRTSGSDGNRLMLLGHLDTVYPNDPPGDGLRDDPEDVSRLLGPGVTDMKGGVVVMLAAVRALALEGFLDDRALSLVFSADEETGSPTAREMIFNEAQDHDLCLVFETGSPAADGATTFVTERKGCGRVSIEILGVESHAGAAKTDGVSAALEAAHKIIALEALNDPDAGISVNVGVVRSGTVSNTVPGRAEMDIDYRFRTSQQGEETRERIDAICREASGPADRAEVTVTVEHQDPGHMPLERTDAVGRMAKRLVDWGSDLGLKLEEEFRGGSSDGNIASEAGCPTLDGLGTVGGRIHSGDEWVLKDSLVDRASLLVIAMMRFYQL